MAGPAPRVVVPVVPQDASMSAPDPFDEPDEDELLTDWERDLLASMDAWEGEPIDAQQAKLDEIEEALPIRRQLWRERKWPRFVR